jgi:hypothetical protein
LIAWCAGLPRATLSTAAMHAGRDMARALDSIGLGAEALGWANAPFDDGDRAVALARLAVAQRSSELLVEAWQLAPWDTTTFVRLLVEADVDDPKVFEIAADKIYETRRDGYGGAAAAWLHMRKPTFEPAKQRAVAERNRHSYNPESQLVNDAGPIMERTSGRSERGMWRAGDATLREGVLEKFEAAYSPWAVAVTIAAAPCVVDLFALMSHVEARREELKHRACDRLIELGEIDRSRDYAKSVSEACEAYVAWQTGDRMRIDEIAARAEEHVLQYDEGLISRDDLRDIRIAVGAATSDRTRIRQVAKDAISATLEQGCEDALAYLGGGRPVAKDISTADLGEAIATWTKDMPILKRFCIRRAAQKILRAATAHAQQGERDRGLELFNVFYAPYVDPEDLFEVAGVGCDDLVIALVALGNFEFIEKLAAASPLSPVAVGHYVPALVTAGDVERAVTLLDGALAMSQSRQCFLDLLPAVLALAGDDVERVHVAWRVANESVAALQI